MKWIAGLAGLALVALPAGQCFAQQSYGTAQRSNGTRQNQQAGTAQSLEAQAQHAIKLFKEENPKAESYFSLLRCLRAFAAGKRA